MRAFSLLTVLACALAACSDAGAPEAYSLRPAPAHPDSLLARLDARALDAAFDALGRSQDTAGYTVQVSALEMDDDGSALGSFEATARVGPRGVEVLRRSVEGTLADTDEARSGFVAFDPVARLLPKEPPFQNPATREMYASEITERRGAVVTAVAERREGSDPILRAEVSVDTTTGQVVAAEVVRASDAAVYAEHSTARVELDQSVSDAWHPVRGTLRTRIDTPLRPPRRVHVYWQVVSVGGAPLDSLALR